MRARLNWILGIASIAMITAALYMALVYAPTEAEQGDVQRIFYFHLPCAWVAFLAYGLVAIAGVLYLWLGQRLWDELGYAAAEVGTVFCFLTLVTGSIWARPIWGVWWTWDSRLTTTLILCLMYVGYLMLRAVADDTEQVARFAAVIGIISALDVPVVIISVRLWRTIHPAVLLTHEGEHGLTDPRMLAALGVSMVAFTALFAWLLVLRLGIVRTRARALELRRDLAIKTALGAT